MFPLAKNFLFHFSFAMLKIDFSATTNAAGATNLARFTTIVCMIVPSPKTTVFAAVKLADPTSIRAMDATKNLPTSLSLIFKTPTTSPKTTRANSIILPFRQPIQKKYWKLVPMPHLTKRHSSLIFRYP